MLVTFLTRMTLFVFLTQITLFFLDADTAEKRRSRKTQISDQKEISAHQRNQRPKKISAHQRNLRLKNNSAHQRNQRQKLYRI